MVARNCQNCSGRHRPRPARRADSGPYEANGALAQGAAGTRNLPTAQATLLTPVRDERDPTTPTRRPCNPLPLEKSHIARPGPLPTIYRGGTTVEAARMSCLHTGSA